MNTHYYHIVTVCILVFSLFSSFPGAVRAADHGSHGSHGSGGPRPAARGHGMETGEQRVYTAVGVVESVDPAARKAVIAHEPVPALGWPAMTMGFVFEDAAPAEEVKAGDRVRFDFRGAGDAFVIVDIEVRR
jgi:Cu/Ag efflux protein CusF